jgi:anti-sigma-K factor RskA
MSVHLDERADVSAGFALGTLDEAEHMRHAEHLANGCEECGETLERMNSALVVVARATTPAVPPVMMRTKVLEDALVLRSRESEKVKSVILPGQREVAVDVGNVMSWKGWLAIWVALVLAISLSVSYREVVRLRAQLGEANGLLGRVSQTMTEGLLWGQIVKASDARVALLEPAGGSGPRGWVTWDPATGRTAALFTGVHAGAGQAYALWAKAGDRFERLGGLSADPSGHAVLRLEGSKARTGVTEFAVSLEPANAPIGQVPTGPLVATGKIGG